MPQIFASCSNVAPSAVSVRPEPDRHTSPTTRECGDFVGASRSLRQAQALLREVAATDLMVLITGETGTGKGIAARAVHDSSRRESGPFIPVNCGGIPENLVESELFGHEKGAFTGALTRKLGKVEIAGGGTLFLDEIGDLSPQSQTVFLQILQEGTFSRVGGNQILQSQARIVAATNRDLRQMVSAGTFREDLYFRLQVFPVHLPPLRERREDVPNRVTHFINRMAADLHKEVTEVEPDALAAMQAYAWPGNIRELEHAVQRAIVVCRGPVIRREHVTTEFGCTHTSQLSEPVTLEEHERRYITQVLERTKFLVEGRHGAAAILGIPGSTLRFRMKKLGIRRRRD